MSLSLPRWAGLPLLATLVHALPAWACDCPLGPPTAERAQAQPGAVVLGRVRSVAPTAAAPGARGSNLEVTVAVERVLSGAVGATLSLDWDATLCTPSVAQGERVLLYVATGSAGRLAQVSGCDGSSRVVTAAEADAEVARWERRLQQCVAGLLLEAVEVREDRAAPALDPGVRPGAGGR